MTLATAQRSVIARFGQAYTLRKELPAAGANSWTRGAVSAAYVAAFGHGSGFDNKDLRGGLAENEELIVLDASKTFGTPQVNDRIAAGAWATDAGAEWRHITNVYKTDVNGKIMSYRLTVRR